MELRNQVAGGLRLTAMSAHSLVIYISFILHICVCAYVKDMHILERIRKVVAAKSSHTRLISV